MVEEEKLQNLSQLNENDLRPEFILQCKELRNYIFDNFPQK